MELSACQFIKLMATQAWPEEGQILVDKATHGVKVYGIVGLNTIFPSNIVHEIFPSVERLMREGKFELRIIEKASMGIYISDDTQAGLMFPNKNGVGDVNSLFISNDPIFCEWCSDIFEYFWQHSGPVYNLKKLKSVDI
jgi:predicted transcriptional regulator